MIVVAADPGTGISSPTGFSAFDPVTKEILYKGNLGTKKKLLQHRIKDISDTFEAVLKDVMENHPKRNILVCIESFVMRGKGGETLQRLIGSFMGRLPYNVELLHVQNTKVKLCLAGHGHADKHQVAGGVAEWFSSNDKSTNTIVGLTLANEYDILDSLAIGVTGWQMYQGEVPKPKAQKRKLSSTSTPQK
jgi:Holliday junction resolvasome RuvABC endonuclease subunit